MGFTISEMNALRMRILWSRLTIGRKKSGKPR